MGSNKKTFAQLVDDYIQEKRAMGYDFEKGIQMLRRIVALQQEIDRGIPCLSAELVERWVVRTPWENEANRSHRLSALRGLGEYMARIGYTAIVVPRRFSPVKDYSYVPYIFTKQELGLILGTVDQICSSGITRHSDRIYPLVFRILIGCGTRITETLHIEKQDINLEQGTLLLHKTKNQKERIVPMADSLRNRCRDYVATTRSLRGFVSPRWLFPNAAGVPYNAQSLYGVFRRVLRLAGISHGGKGKGPRLHDLRHTFAVNVLNKWVREGRHLTTALPYLSLYMGHAGLKASQHYLRLTTQMYPDLIKSVEEKYGWIIPGAYHA
jgi:integrase/recombinase XerD